MGMNKCSFPLTLSELLILLFQVYDLQYKVLIDGEERDSLMEIDSANRIEVFRTGNGSEEVLEIHDFKNVSTILGMRSSFFSNNTAQLSPATFNQRCHFSLALFSACTVSVLSLPQS